MDRIAVYEAVDKLDREELSVTLSGQSNIEVGTQIKRCRIDVLVRLGGGGQGWLTNSDDLERPLDGKYYDLDRVSWYARLPFAGRMDYLDWIIAKREAEYTAWYKEREAEDSDRFAIWRLVSNPILEELMRLRKRRDLEIDDQSPLPEWQRGPDKRRNYRDSGRWKRRPLATNASTPAALPRPGIAITCTTTTSASKRTAT
jgi:hypothetical protein